MLQTRPVLSTIKMGARTKTVIRHGNFLRAAVGSITGFV
jgi:hypothetical protein